MELEELKKQVDTLWKQDFPNQKAVLDLQTRVGSLEKKLEELNKLRNADSEIYFREKKEGHDKHSRA